MIKPKYIKVQDDPGFVRDTYNNAIIATDLSEKKAYLEAQKRELNISRIGEMNDRIEKLENNIDEIKMLLLTLINNNRT